MNTTRVGDAFEEKIYRLLEREIADGRFPVKREFCKLFRKKDYHSKDREGNIRFDIAIEVWMQGATNYSNLYLIECKKYSHPVPVNEVEEFYAKVDQVSGVNAKGIFVTTNSLQAGTFNYARSKGMAVIRYYTTHKLGATVSTAKM